jgi:SAM-dependent methyltransferase
MDRNQEQIEFWNSPAAERWVKYQVDFDRAIGAFGNAALAALPLAAGARVLDVGCGTGSTTLQIVERVAPGGSVVGVDVSQLLLARARERVPERAAALRVGLDLKLADAATYRAPKPFDALFSRFGVMFFDQPVSAFANLRSALAPGGRIAFVCWRALAENPWTAVPLKAARRVVPPPVPAPDPRAPGPFAFAEQSYVQGIIADAGFGEIEIAAFDAPVLIGNSGLSDVVEQTLRLGPTGRVIVDQPADVKARVREEIARDIAPRMEDDALSLPGAAWLVTAHAP